MEAHDGVHGAPVLAAGHLGLLQCGGEARCGGDLEDLGHDGAADLVVDAHGHLAAAALQARGEGAQEQDDDVVQRDRRGRQGDHARPAGHADGGAEPDGGGGGQASDGVVVDEDDPGAQKADTGDDLRGHTAGVHRDIRAGDRGEAVGGHQGEQARAQSHQDMRLDTGVLVAQVALGAQRHAQDEGGEHRDDLNPHVVQAEQRVHTGSLPCRHRACPAGSRRPPASPLPAQRRF